MPGGIDIAGIRKVSNQKMTLNLCTVVKFAFDLIKFSSYEY